MRRTAMIAAVLSVGMLTACQTQEAPSPPPTSQPALTTATPEPAPTTEAAPTTAEPAATTTAPEATTTEPEAVIDTSEEGAEAFVEDWVRVFNNAYQTGDAEALEALQTADCTSCNALAGLLQEPSQETEYLSISHLKPTLLDGSAHVETEITQAATPGSPEQTGTAVFELIQEEDRWVLSEIRVVPDA